MRLAPPPRASLHDGDLNLGGDPPTESTARESDRSRLPPDDTRQAAPRSDTAINPQRRTDRRTSVWGRQDPDSCRVIRYVIPHTGDTDGEVACVDYRTSLWWTFEEGIAWSVSGDYFGDTTMGTTDITTFVSTVNGGTIPFNRQQQVVARLPIPESVVTDRRIEC
jgi:hypothetical protein